MYIAFKADDEPVLPYELRKFEELLSRIRPSEFRIDRDELMYRCGWAAAMAQHRSREACEPKVADDS